MEEYGNIPFTDCKLVHKYRDPVEPNSLSANFSAVLPVVPSLLNYRVEQTLILTDITWDKNKVLEDKSNKTIKFYGL